MPPSRLRLLSPGQRRLLAFVLGGATLLLGNSVYLAVASHVLRVGQNPHDLPGSYQVSLAFHVILGLAIFLPSLIFAGWHLPRAMLRKTPGATPTGIAVLVLSTFLLVSGLFILTAANSRENQWAFIGHQAAACLLPILYFAHRWCSKDRPEAKTRWIAALRIGAITAALLVIHLVERSLRAPSATANADSARTSVSSGSRLPVGDPFVPFRPVGDVDPNSPFFPSSTTTTSGGFLPARVLTHDDLPDLARFQAETKTHGFASESYLGAQTCVRCHADTVDQWAQSAHRFASFNNLFYRKSVELLRETRSPQTSQWCGGCHDPAIMLAGNMPKEIDPLTPESQAGLTCLACHAIDRLHGTMGNGAYNIQDAVPSPYLFADNKSGFGQALHDYVLKAKPTAHKADMLKPMFRTSEFCSACHKVALDVPVNRYRWVRGQNEYDAWHNSGMAHNQPMTWYEPAATKSCQDCHMPLEDAPRGDLAAKGGKIKSHRFLAANTALPHLRGDQDMIARTEAYLRDQKLRVDIFALHREGAAEPVFPLDRERPPLRRGEVVQVDVVVRNLGVGHTFPGGTNDSNEGWIDFRVSQGTREIWRSGAVQPDHHVDPYAHLYQAVLVDKDSQRIARRNPADIHATVYANVIPPSGSDVARYRFRIPADLPPGELTIEARLLWRKFNRTFTEFVFEGKPVPNLPITEIASHRQNLPLSEGDGPAQAASSVPESDWGRFNDYGIAHFLDGDTKSADRAFARVAELAPNRVDGWRNRARTALREGDLGRAEELLRKASTLAEDDPKLAFFWGQLLTEQGRLEAAVTAFRRVLEVYPESRDSWAGLGRAHWQQGDATGTLTAFLEVLKIDPEDAFAHYQRSLAYKKLLATEPDPAIRAELEHAVQASEAAFSKYKIDEDAPAKTQQYRQNHPADNLMSQSIVIHSEAGL